MNAICPRCGTVSLAGAQTKHFTCKICRLRFCNECQHWKVDRKQNYCAGCGAMFSVPPPVMPLGISAVLLHVPLVAAIILHDMIPLQFWQLVFLVVAPPLAYTSAYLAKFYRRTGLARAVRREAILLGRRALMLAAIVYVVMTLGSQSTLVIGLVAAIVLVLIGLAAQRTNPVVIEEMQTNRSVWGAILSMSGRDALLMRFPDASR